ncbi:MAG TPA: hypothetical protein VK691_07520 [Solirubrobacteraceae bacterium]|nr:hypothetical protein [Solirubrobacteraceae bacterium]
MYVGVPETKVIDVFNSSNAFVEQIPDVNGCAADSAFDDMSGKLECGGLVAADDSQNLRDEGRGDVYFAGNNTEQGFGGEIYNGGFVRRLNSSGGPADFTCKEQGKTPEYIKNGNELIGNSREPWGAGNTLLAPVDGIAVDSGSGEEYAGDIYVINIGLHDGSFIEEVDRFSPAGCFLRSFSEAGTPPKPFNASGGNKNLHGIAVDPSGGDVVVPITETKSTGGESEGIDEFTDEGKYLGQITGTSKDALFGENALRDGIGGGIVDTVAFNSEGDLYAHVCEKYNPQLPSGQDTGFVGCEKNVVDQFGRGAFYSGVVSGGVSGARFGAVTLNGTVRGVVDNIKDVDVPLSECYFEYVSEEAYAQSMSEGKGGFSSGEVERAQCAQGLVGQRLEEKNYAVSAEVTKGLVAGRTYRYRLVAATEPGEVERGGVNEEAAVESFAAPAEPVVEGVSVGDVSSSWADFHLTVDPVGEATTYQVQYVRASLYNPSAGDPYTGGGVAPGSPGSVGSGDTGVSVSVQAGGLRAGTSYDYRVVASNGVGVFDGGNGVFSTSPAVGSGASADGRAYEMVTPPNKEDAENLFGGVPNVEAETNHEDLTNYDRGYSSEDGEHFLLLTTAAFGGFPASGEDSYVFSRGADGWSVRAGASPTLGVQSGYAAVYDPLNFSAIGFKDFQFTGSEVHRRVLNLVGPAGGPYTTIDSGEENSTAAASMLGASEDLGRVVLASADHELAPAPNNEKQDENSDALYEWSAGEGLRLANIGTQGELLKCGAILGQDGEQKKPEGGVHGAVSADGSRVIFTAPDPHGSGSGCWKGASNPPEVYARVNGESTVELSAPDEGVEEAPGDPSNPAEPAIYVGASKDGSRVFFMTRTELSEEAVKLGLHDVELYEYDSKAPEGQRVTRVSTGEEGAPGRVAGAMVEAAVAVSSDGSAVYFTATGQLTSDAPADGGLYRYDANTHKTMYVAPSPGYPAPQNKTGGGIVGETWYATVLAGANASPQTPYAGLAAQASYYTTGDGDYLVFGSTQNITGYDSGGREELYRYTYEPGSPSGGRVVCVSCDPTGAVPSYPARFTRSAVTGDNPGATAPRPISENGDYVFFDSQESLLPAATNDKIDVYEWEIEGTGTCQQGIGGCLSLISTGQSSSDDYFLDSSPDGKNVFFGTHSKLVPADNDEEGDLYDARIGGGFPAPIGAGPCEGDACENPSPAPMDQTPASLSFSGPGDIASEVAARAQSKTKTVTKKAGKCRAGYVKRKGKCVKAKASRQAARKGSARKSSRRKGGK